VNDGRGERKPPVELCATAYWLASTGVFPAALLTCTQAWLQSIVGIDSILKPEQSPLV
jgi:hypothetical protein